MRYLIPAAALALGALAWSARGREAEAPRRPMPTLQAPARLEEAAMPSPAAETETREVETRRPAEGTSTSSVPAAEAPAPKPFAAPGWALELGRELNLDERQKAWVAEILRERAQALAAYGKEVRARGWFRIEDFGRRAGEIRETCYDRIELLLNPEQARAFARLRPGLIHKDFFSIAIPETEVVCLD